MRRRHQPCFDFVREVKIELKNKDSLEEDVRNGNLLSNLTVENGTVKSFTKRKDLSVPALQKLIQEGT